MGTEAVERIGHVDVGRLKGLSRPRQLSVQPLVSAQVLVPGLWDGARSKCSLSLPPSPSPSSPLALSLLKIKFSKEKKDG